MNAREMLEKVQELKEQCLLNGFDLISRQDVIHAIEDDDRNGHYSCFASHSDAQKFKQIVNDLPSAERKHGKWIVLYDENSPQDGIWKCSACDYIRLADDIAPINYCPNCGARMVEE